MDSDKYYEKYKNLSDNDLLDAYQSVAEGVKNDASMDTAFEMAAIVKLVQERKLNMAQHLMKKGKEKSKQDAKRLLKDYRKEGWRFLIIGAIIFSAGFALTAGTRAIFYGALVVGGLFILAGIFLLTSGFGMGFYAWWKFRK